MEKVNKRCRPSVLSKNLYKRRSESEMIEIITEIHSGCIAKRAACVKYGLNRNTLALFIKKFAVRTLGQDISTQMLLFLTLVKELRQKIRILGTRKLLFMLSEEFQRHAIKMGRDKLFDLLRFHGLLIRKRKRTVKTTDSHHWLKKYPNLIKELVITTPEQL